MGETYESVINPVDEFVAHLKRQVKDNNGFCIFCEDHNNKRNRCPKFCGKDAGKCECGMYVKSYFDEPLYDN